jgi:hypothetical protein
MKTPQQLETIARIKPIVRRSITALNEYTQNPPTKLVDGPYARVITVCEDLDFCSQELDRIELDGSALRTHYNNLRDRCDQVYLQLNRKMELVTL